MTQFLRTWPTNFPSNHNKHTFRVAVSGGSSLHAIAPLLSLSDVCANTVAPWELFVVDERFVPGDDADSNQKKITATFGTHLPHTCHWWHTEQSIGACLEAYNTHLKTDEHGNFFDLTILGVGPDGHTASIFPDTKTMPAGQKTAHTTTDVFAVHDRVTLTLESIKKSKEIWIVLIGEHKQEVWERLQKNEINAAYPASIAASWPQTKVIWIPD